MRILTRAKVTHQAQAGFVLHGRVADWHATRRQVCTFAFLFFHLAQLVYGVAVRSHVGDSRVIMVDSNGAVDELAPDHHPDAPRERERVEGRGGEIVFRGCWRVHSPQEGMYLAVSRAFGDVSLKEPTLIIDAEPDVTIRHIVPANRWLIIGA